MIETTSPQVKIDFLREWCELVLRFLSAFAPGGVLRQLEHSLTSSWERADEAELAAIAEDLAVWGRALDEARQAELDALLCLRFGTGLTVSAPPDAVTVLTQPATEEEP